MIDTKDLKIKVLQKHKEGFESWRAFIDLTDKDIDAREFEEYIKELGFDVKYELNKV